MDFRGTLNGSEQPGQEVHQECAQADVHYYFRDYLVGNVQLDQLVPVEEGKREEVYGPDNEIQAEREGKRPEDEIEEEEVEKKKRGRSKKESTEEKEVEKKSDPTLETDVEKKDGEIF